MKGSCTSSLGAGCSPSHRSMSRAAITNSSAAAVAPASAAGEGSVTQTCVPTVVRSSAPESAAIRS